MTDKTRTHVTFYHYYCIAYPNQSLTSLERDILENYAHDIGFDKQQIETLLLSKKHEQVTESSLANIEFLYGLYLSTTKHYPINKEVLAILKKYCLMVGFYDSNIDKLSKTLIINAKNNVPFQDLICLLKDY